MQTSYLEHLAKYHLVILVRVFQWVLEATPLRIPVKLQRLHEIKKESIWEHKNKWEKMCAHTRCHREGIDLCAGWRRLQH
jgi:hypothetical protein